MDCPSGTDINFDEGTTLLELFERKGKKAVQEIAERNLEFLHIYLDFEATDYRGLHPLAAAERAFQLQLAEELRAVENKDKRDCIQKYHDQPVGSILQEAWFRDYPDYKPVRRKKRAQAAMDCGSAPLTNVPV